MNQNFIRVPCFNVGKAWRLKAFHCWAAKLLSLKERPIKKETLKKHTKNQRAGKWERTSTKNTILLSSTKGLPPFLFSEEQLCSWALRLKRSQLLASLCFEPSLRPWKLLGHSSLGVSSGRCCAKSWRHKSIYELDPSEVKTLQRRFNWFSVDGGSLEVWRTVSQNINHAKGSSNSFSLPKGKFKCFLMLVCAP